MDGYEHGDLLSYISNLGFEIQGAMRKTGDGWILKNWWKD
jgi:hypothetical protein